MHITLSFIALVLSALFYVPTSARFGLRPRLLCVQDDVYDGFHNAPPEDVDPLCSSWIGIQDVSVTRVGHTSRTTTVTTTTIYTPAVYTTTLTSNAATVTTTIGDLQGREAAPAPTPAAQLAQLYSAVPVLQEPECSDISSTVSSACSCLLLGPQTVPVLITTTITRIETADDYEGASAYVTELIPSTSTVTALPTPLSNNTLPGSSGFLPTSSALSIPSVNVSGSPVPIQNATLLPTSPVVQPTTSAPVNSSTSALPVSVSISVSTTGVSPTAAPFSVCPAGDKTTITELDGEQFQILCNTNFTGPTTQGLMEPSLGACIQQCSLNNDGFSATRCYGASYFPDQLGSNCYLKTQEGVATADFNPAYRIVSGVLITKPASNSTTNTTTSPIPPSSTPTNSLNNTGTIPPFGPESNGGRNGGGSTSTPSASGLPTGFPNNITSSVSASLFPVASANVTTSAGPTAISSVYLNSTSLPSSAYPPTNVTSLTGPTAPPILLNTTASLFPSLTLNATAPPSLTPTPSYNLTSTPSGFPSSLYNFTTPTSNSTAISSGRPFNSYNASICYSTDWVTAYTTQSLCSSTVTITAFATSHTTTVTELFLTLTA